MAGGIRGSWRGRRRLRHPGRRAADGAAPPRHQQDRSLEDLEACSSHGVSRRGPGRHRLGVRRTWPLASRTADAAHATRLDARSGELRAAARTVRHHGGGARALLQHAGAAQISQDRGHRAGALPGISAPRALARPDVGFQLWARWQARRSTGARPSASAAPGKPCWVKTFVASQPRSSTWQNAAAAHARAAPGPARGRPLPGLTSNTCYVNGRYRARSHADLAWRCGPPSKTCCTARASRVTCVFIEIDAGAAWT
jgi:DNA mismatch repair protein MutL